MRVALYSLVGLILAGLAACGYLLVRSLSAEPGANMLPMGIPVIAGPVALLGLALLALVWWCGEGIRPV